MLLPKIDKRNKKDIVEQIKVLSQAYTPEWNFDPESDDVGSAFSVIFSRMYYELLERFNKIPYKNFIAFLNMIDTNLLSIVPAEGYISFNLSIGTQKGIYVPKNQPIFAVSQITGERVVFETQGNLFLTPAQITDIFQVDPKEDEIRITYENEEEGIPKDFYLFHKASAKNVQERILSIGSSRVFYVTKNGEIEIEFDVQSSQNEAEEIVKQFAERELFKWSLITNNDSVEIKNIIAKGRTLIIPIKEDYYKEQKNTEEQDFLYCQAINNNHIEDILLKKIFIKSKNTYISPYKIFSNDLEQPIERFYPFRERFSSYDAFYICNDEVFSKKGAYIELILNYQYKKNDIEIEMPEKEVNWKLIMKKVDFKEPKEYNIKIEKVIWEYWDGNGWARLFMNAEYEEIFYDEGVEEYYQKKIVFKCPEDISKTFVNTHEGFWIRARIIDIENMFKTRGYYIAPFIQNMFISYQYKEEHRIPQSVFIRENLETNDISNHINSLEIGVNLFKRIRTEGPSIYIGFDSPLIGVPIKVLFNIYKNEVEENSKLHWEYLSGVSSNDQWSPLTVFDETDSFRHSGIVTIIGPEDFKMSKIFNKERYWIRIIDEEKRYSAAKELWKVPKVKSIYMNSIHIKQEESVDEEYFYIENQQQNQECTLLNSKVMSAEVWVNEFGFLSDEELEKVKRFYSLNFVKDEIGEVQEIWVKWDEIDNFALSSPEGRHYILDRFEGRIYFGDGEMGKIPPAQEDESILVKYCISKGNIGNMDSFEINTLGSSLAYIDEVFNPEPTFGGADRETLEEALIRGPKKLKHLQRAVTNNDFEELVKEASRNINKVKCIPNINCHKQREAGSITMVIMPEHYSSNNRFNLIEKQVKDYLRGNLPGILEFADKFYVLETNYLEISTTVEVIPQEWADFYELEKKIQERLKDFLNPIQGNYDKKGWDIGDVPTSTIIYNYINVVEGIKAIHKFSIKATLIDGKGKKDIDFDKLINKEFMTVVSGTHKIKICIL